MILLTSKLIKLLLLFFILIIIYGYLERKYKTNKNKYVFLLILLLGLLANSFSNLLPPIYDEISLCAVGESRKDAGAVEICLKGYMVDNTFFSAGKNLYIEKGHWFWSGEEYCWRPEADVRKPDGITDSITVRIPVGWERTLTFSGGIWRGFVEIKNSDNHIIIDTFTDDYTDVNVSIGRSDTKLLIYNQIRYLAAYFFSLLAFSIVVVCCVCVSLKQNDHGKALVKEYIGKLIYLCLSLITFFLMLCYSKSIPLWADEMYQIGTASQSIMETVDYCVKMIDLSPPLFVIFANLWYHLAPYGEPWLYLLTIIPCVISVYILGVLGERFANKYIGIMSSMFFAFSSTVWIYAAYEFRPYAFLVMFTTLSIFFYVKRNDEQRQTKWGLCFGLSMTGMMLSHYFGFIAFVGFIFGDIYLWLRHQIKVKKFLFYIIPCISFFVWIIIIYFSTLQGRSAESLASWYGIPDFNQIKVMLRFISGNIDISYKILLIAFAIGIYILLAKFKNFSYDDFYFEMFALMILGTLSSLYIYGNYINTSSTMWQERYFVFLIPFVTLLLSLTIYKIINCFKTVRLNGFALNTTLCICLGLVFYLNCIFTVTNVSWPAQPYKASADWLYSQSNDVFNDSTIIIAAGSKPAIDGWEQYYITQQGRRDPLNVVSQYDIDVNFISQYDVIYVQYIHSALSTLLQEYLEENYVLLMDDVNLQIRAYKRM